MSGHICVGHRARYRLLQSHSCYLWHDKGSQNVRVVPKRDYGSYHNKMNCFQKIEARFLVCLCVCVCYGFSKVSFWF